jgi:integrase/recombinase XerC
MTTTLEQAKNQFLDMIGNSRKKRTKIQYETALRSLWALFSGDFDLKPSKTPVNEISEIAPDLFKNFIALLNDSKAPSTTQVYTTAAISFFEFLNTEGLTTINLERCENYRKRARRSGQRIPSYPEEEILKVIGYAEDLALKQTEDQRNRLINLRDRAFIVVLADSGLRVHEACNLKRGDLNANTGKAVIIGKGDKEAIIRFSERSMTYIADYLAARRLLDGNNPGKRLDGLPLFARHDPAGHKKTLPVSTTTGRKIVDRAVASVLGLEALGSITPHSFRHYFVTTVLRGSGGNLKLAQELARHSNISTTSIYSHLVDDELQREYDDIFNS